jgi:hypothetical protein
MYIPLPTLRPWSKTDCKKKAINFYANVNRFGQVTEEVHKLMIIPEYHCTFSKGSCSADEEPIWGLKRKA